MGEYLKSGNIPQDTYKVLSISRLTMYPLRTRFKKEIVAEFLPPAKLGKHDKVIIICDGMPGVPKKRPLLEFLSKKDFGLFIRAIAARGKVMGSF